MSKIVDTEIKNITYYTEAIKSSADSDFIGFLKWFNGGENLNEIINSGYKDFFVSILQPYIYSKTKADSKKLTALEIGCGGGRILNAACKYFRNAVGVDIHDSFGALEKFMKLENNNFQLHKIIENRIPVSDNSIDFIYSFIVFQHILKINVFTIYLSEIQRILKPNGTVIIYFGRPRLLSKHISRKKTLNFFTQSFDRFIYEGLYLNIFKGGFCENYNAKVNHVNLTVSIRKAKKIFKAAGLKIIEKGQSKNKNVLGTQYFFIATQNKDVHI